MANNQFMALFGPDSVVASVLSETNSVKYKLCVRGSNNDSRITDVEVSINDVDIIDRATHKGRGLNLAVIDANTSTLVEWKYYDIYSSNRDPVVSAFKDYITNLPINRIVAIYSFDAMRSTAELDTFMRTYMGSLAWAGSLVLNEAAVTNVKSPARASYCAIYNSKMRKIVAENFVGNVFSSYQVDTRSFVEIVYDELDDVGATGIPQRIVDDPTERMGDGSVYRVYTWPNPQTVGTDIFAGDLLSINADLFQDQALTDAGGYAVISVYSQNSNGAIIDEKRLDSRGGTVGQFVSKSDFYTVPLGAAAVGCTFYHFPSTVKTGTSKLKNVVLTKVSRLPKETGTAAIGVNGIRLTTMKERDANGNENPIEKLLSLSVGESGTSPSKIVTGNFSEMETIVSESTTIESTSSSAIYEFKNWANSVKISSYNVKPGDKLILSAELMRDATAITNGKYPWLTVDFNDASGTLISTDGIEGVTTIPNIYDFYKKEIVVPANTDNITIRAFRGPKNITATGNVYIRNFICRINRGA